MRQNKRYLHKKCVNIDTIYDADCFTEFNNIKFIAFINAFNASKRAIIAKCIFPKNVCVFY